MAICWCLMWIHYIYDDIYSLFESCKSCGDLHTETMWLYNRIGNVLSFFVLEEFHWTSINSNMTVGYVKKQALCQQGPMQYYVYSKIVADLFISCCMSIWKCSQLKICKYCCCWYITLCICLQNKQELKDYKFLFLFISNVCFLFSLILFKVYPMFNKRFDYMYILAHCSVGLAMAKMRNIPPLCTFSRVHITCRQVHQFI